MRRTPPAIRDLMDDPTYLAYMRTLPRTTTTHGRVERPHPGLTIGDPWQVWVRTPDGRWLTGRKPTYRDAWSLFAKHYRGDAADVAIVSRRVFFPPPGDWRKVRVRKGDGTKRIEERWFQTFFWDEAYFEWCARCRRPSVFKPLNATHHALRRSIAITTDEPNRCVYCGIRRVAMPLDYRSLVEK